MTDANLAAHRRMRRIRIGSISRRAMTYSRRRAFRRPSAFVAGNMLWMPARCPARWPRCRKSRCRTAGAVCSSPMQSRPRRLKPQACRSMSRRLWPGRPPGALPGAMRAGHMPRRGAGGCRVSPDARMPKVPVGRRARRYADRRRRAAHRQSQPLVERPVSSCFLQQRGEFSARWQLHIAARGGREPIGRARCKRPRADCGTQMRLRGRKLAPARITSRSLLARRSATLMLRMKGLALRTSGDSSHATRRLLLRLNDPRRIGGTKQKSQPQVGKRRLEALLLEVVDAFLAKDGGGPARQIAVGPQPQDFLVAQPGNLCGKWRRVSSRNVLLMN